MATVSDRPWGQFTAASYSVEQWKRACLVDTGQGDPNTKGRYKVPVREPSGVLNRGGVMAAAGGHGLGAVTGCPPGVIQAAARELMGLYKTIGEDPPSSLMDMAGMAMSGRSAVPDFGGSMFRGFAAAEPQEHYRSFEPDLSVKPGGDGRTVYGIAVPWGRPTRIDDGLVEQWARGAFDHQMRDPMRVKFEREHVPLGGKLIGAATMMRNDPAGLYIELHTSKTPVGDETLELVRDGALDQLSVHFRERQNRRLAGGVVERVQAQLKAVAIVMEGAYGELATASGVRSGRGETISAATSGLMAKAEPFLLGLPPLPDDHDLEIRALRLGLPRPQGL